MVDSNLYIKSKNNQVIIMVYIDDSIFGGGKDEICKAFAN